MHDYVMADTTIEVVLEEMRISPHSWHPSFPGGLVRVRYTWIARAGRTFGRISVWGADDTGRERDFEDREEMDRVWEILPAEPTFENLEALGFESA